MGESKRIEGFFIEFSEKEIEQVRHALMANGYNPDGKGIKQFLLFALFDDEEDAIRSNTQGFIDNIQNYVTNHPEAIEFGLATLKKIADKIRKVR